MRRKCTKNYPKKLVEKGLTTSKSFWKFIKPFFTNNGFTRNSDITRIHKNKIISDEKLTKLFNSYYINIIEKSSDTKPETFSINFDNTYRLLEISYKNHPGITNIQHVAMDPMFLIVKDFPPERSM